jgi:glycosyltransferase involved in cell wall biosynthesis
LNQSLDDQKLVKVITLTRYGRLGASSRLRSMQYAQVIKSFGISLEIFPLFSDEYLRATYSRSKWRAIWALRDLMRRMLLLLKLRNSEGIIWVEKELVPYLPAFLERRLYPRGRSIIDIDDAIFHQYDQNPRIWIRHLLGNKLKMVFNRSAAVTAGNEYLAAYAKSAGAANVQIIPTVIDLDRYSAKVEYGENAVPQICWIGSPATSQYIFDHLPILDRLAQSVAFQLIVIGVKQLRESRLYLTCKQWSEASEVSDIAACDVGIMPLPDSLWERGKCGYKLIQYMACGLPVVASAVGANNDIIVSGETGFLARTEEDWIRQLSLLLQDSNLMMTLGRQARIRVERGYSVQAISCRLAKILNPKD